jgi:hypothetical protein
LLFLPGLRLRAILFFKRKCRVNVHRPTPGCCSRVCFTGLARTRWTKSMRYRTDPARAYSCHTTPTSTETSPAQPPLPLHDLPKVVEYATEALMEHSELDLLAT